MRLTAAAKLATAILLALAALLSAACGQDAGRNADAPTAVDSRSMSPVAALGGRTHCANGAGTAAPDDGFKRAIEPRPFQFPSDHGQHPDFQTEWWYLTGHLDSVTTGERFGFQWTVFRRALAPPSRAATEAAAGRDSAWATRQLFLGHFALGELDQDRFHSFERADRGALGLAGANAHPARIWLGDWQLAALEPESPSGLWPASLRADGASAAIDLVLDTVRSPVLHGDRGLSRKGVADDSASFYYSYTRIEATGTVDVNGQQHEVEGTAWLDHEWSTSVLAPEQEGWDWFSIQLDGGTEDGRELMVFQLRESGGGISAASSGSLIDASQSGKTTQHLPRDQFDIEVTDRWRSPHSGVAYPAGWRLRVPGHGLDLELTPAIADQEMQVGLRYWEGAIEVQGTADGKPITGRGFAELVGYEP